MRGKTSLSTRGVRKKHHLMNPHSQNTPITSSSPQSFSYTYWEEDDGVIVVVTGPVLSCSCKKGSASHPTSESPLIPLLEYGVSCHLLFSVLNLGQNPKTQRKNTQSVTKLNQLLDKTSDLNAKKMLISLDTDIKLMKEVNTLPLKLKMTSDKAGHMKATKQVKFIR